MNLQKKLIQLSEYKCSFKYVESYFLVSMTYPESWSIIPCEDRSIEVAEEDGVTFYAAPIETDIEKAFNLIDDTIAYNLDVEKKMNLLKFNINKLQELFATMDLEELETIEFTFKSKTKTSEKVKKARNVTKKSTKKSVKKDKVLVNTIEESADNRIIAPVQDIANGDKLDEVTHWGDLVDNCMDDTIFENTKLEATVEPIKTENKYLEEVKR